MPTVLVLGATGFLGRAISTELHRRGGSNLLLGHRGTASPSARDRMAWVSVDITDLNAIKSAAQRADWIVHVANYIGIDEAEIERTNVLGTASVAQAACETRAQLIYISTASVYGHGPFSGVTEDQLPLSPSSVLSQSRVAAEQHVLARGGIVLRPNLTYGCGDKWFIPTLIAMMKSLNATVDAGIGLASVISVELLAQIVAELVRGTGKTFRGMAVNASHPDPVAFGTIASVLEEEVGIPAPLGNLSLDEAIERAADMHLSPHQVRLLSEDNWFSSAKLWDALALRPPPAAFTLTDSSRRWYLDHLRNG